MYEKHLLNPIVDIYDSITVYTNNQGSRGFIVDTKNIQRIAHINNNRNEKNDSNNLETETYIVKTDNKSNINKLDKIIENKKFRGTIKDTFESRKDGKYTKIWTDNLSRPIVSKTESYNEVYYQIRADMALNMMNNGISFIECNNNEPCDWYYPKKVILNLDKQTL